MEIEVREGERERERGRETRKKGSAAKLVRTLNCKQCCKRERERERDVKENIREGLDTQCTNLTVKRNCF